MALTNFSLTHPDEQLEMTQLIADEPFNLFFFLVFNDFSLLKSNPQLTVLKSNKLHFVPYCSRALTIIAAFTTEISFPRSTF